MAAAVDQWDTNVIVSFTVLLVSMAATAVGNAALLVSVCGRVSRRRLKVNVFLTHVAVGDLGVCVFSMTTEVLFIAFGQWALGPVACKVSVYLQVVCLASATFLLLALTIDRYEVVVTPFSVMASNNSLYCRISACWMAAFVLASPQLFIFKQVTKRLADQEGNVVNVTGLYNRLNSSTNIPAVIHSCASDGYSQDWWQRKVYIVYMTTYILVVPTIVMTYCYVNIISVVWRRNRQNNYRSEIVMLRSLDANGSADRRVGIRGGQSEDCGDDNFSTKNATQQLLAGVASTTRGIITRAKMKAVVVSFVVVAVFVMCWLPYFTITLIQVFTSNSWRLSIALNVSEKLALLRSCFNPILYFCFYCSATTAATTSSTANSPCCKTSQPRQRFITQDATDEDIVGGVLSYKADDMR